MVMDQNEFQGNVMVRLEHIERQLDELKAATMANTLFRTKMYGIAAGISGVVSTAAYFIERLF